MMKRPLILITMLMAGLVSGQPPAEWTVDPTAWEHFMTVTAVLEINDQLSDDSQDVIAAFVGPECRGVVEATSTAGDWRYFLMVRSNSGGEVVTFRAWDADPDTVLDVTNQVSFVVNGAYGTVDEPYTVEAVNTTVGIIETGSLPNTFKLYPNYPNPFNPVTTISYELSERMLVNLVITDLLGRELVTLVDDIQGSGYRSAKWNGVNSRGEPVSTGVYLYRLQAGAFTQTRKMILLK